VTCLVSQREQRTITLRGSCRSHASRVKIAAMTLPKFNLRDLFWIVVVVAMGGGWWREHSGRMAEREAARRPLRNGGDYSRPDRTLDAYNERAEQERMKQ
jgi:hypothetical protein